MWWGKLNIKVVKGYAYEYAVAYHLEDVSEGSAHISREDNQIELAETRREHYRFLEEKYPKDFQVINAMAQEVTEVLPTPVNDIFFVESTNNFGEVYDIYYYDKDNTKIKVSCKTKEVNDKTYSLCNKNYKLESIENLLDNSTLVPDMSNQEYLISNNLVEKICSSLYDLMQDNQSDDYNTFVELNSSHVIGNGGYYKTLPEGGIRYYPENCSGSSFTISNISKTSKNVSYQLSMFSSKDDYEQKYLVKVSPALKVAKNGKIKIVGNCIYGLVLNFQIEILNSYRIL